jgi:tRNA (uracil-5-)-methyltransferase TRM9
MDSRTVARLHSLNKQFYQTFGREFSSTRSRLQPGVKGVLERLNGSENILDLGCGNAGLAQALTRQGHRGRYVGVDFSSPLLKDAEKIDGKGLITFIQSDLLEEDWQKQVIATGTQKFDWVTAFAVMHHIPGGLNRLKILESARSLLKSGGLFIHSEWQFLNSEKLKNRIQPWEAAGISNEGVEPGDYLLDWRSGGRGLRYVHHFNETELSSLAEGSGFRVLETFHSDGTPGNLGLYQIWEAV